MRQTLSAFAAGLLFGLGLIVSGMINPAKVLDFLDLAGDWDASLALVMAGALVIAAPAYQVARKLRKPIFATDFAMPRRHGIDWRLTFGAVMFGVGWGLVGFCPGPAIAALAAGNDRAVLFTAAMLVGMSGFWFVDRSGQTARLDRLRS